MLMLLALRLAQSNHSVEVPYLLCLNAWGMEKE